jgi:uncharacterized membrane protein
MTIFEAFIKALIALGSFVAIVGVVLGLTFWVAERARHPEISLIALCLFLLLLGFTGMFYYTENYAP